MPTTNRIPKKNPKDNRSGNKPPGSPLENRLLLHGMWKIR